MNKFITAKETGERLRKLRGSRRQTEVAEAVGVSTMAISQYENGTRVPQDKIKIRLANYFNESVESIFFPQEVNS